MSRRQPSLVVMMIIQLLVSSCMQHAVKTGGIPHSYGALFSGVGSELRRPLGIAIVGGLIVSQMLTLFTTPVTYLYIDRLRWRARKRQRAPQPSEA